MAGYTQAGPVPDGPDLALLAAMVRALPDVPIIAEGRYHSPALAFRAIDTGAIAVVVGTAITDPAWITRQFAHALRGTSERS